MSYSRSDGRVEAVAHRDSVRGAVKTREAACGSSRRSSASRAALTRLASSAEPPASGWTLAISRRCASRISSSARAVADAEQRAAPRAGRIAARGGRTRAAASQAIDQRPPATSRESSELERSAHQPAIAAWRGSAARAPPGSGKREAGDHLAQFLPRGDMARGRPRRSAWRSSRVRPLGKSSR